MADGGYDVADYRDIDPLFGTLADADALIAEAHALGIRVLLDIVPNHTSDRHPWFQAALAAGPGSRERDRYVFRDGRGPRRRAAPDRLGERLRRTGLDPRDRAGRTARPVVPAPVRAGAARSRLDRAGGPRRVRVDPAVLVRSRRGRLPDRRRARPRQGPGVSRPAPRARRARRSSPARTGTRTASTTSIAAGGPSPTSTAVACSSPRSSSRAPTAWPATCGRTSSIRRSTSGSCRRAGTRPRCAGPSTTARALGARRRAGDLGPVEPRRDPPRDAVRARRRPRDGGGHRPRRPGGPPTSCSDGVGPAPRCC